MNWKVMALVAGASVLASAGAASALSTSTNVTVSGQSSSSVSAYHVVVLDGDRSGLGENVDPQLINPWGLAAVGDQPWVVADNGSGTASLINGNGTASSQVVTVPGDPTGVAFDSARQAFTLRNGTLSGSPASLFASEDGTISAWNPLVSQTQAFVVVDNSASGAVYKGVAVALTVAGARIYATDFHNGRVDVFDGSLKPVTASGGFTDPNLPAGYAPFGIANISGRIVVTYAMQDAAKHDDVKGAGFGFIDIYDVSGALRRRLASAGPLTAPWGLARAPSNFGEFSNAILVGNFGDGRITAYGVTDDMLSVHELGQLSDSSGNPISVEGLWGIAFGNGGMSGSSNALYFAAGPNSENDGVFGNITVAR